MPAVFKGAGKMLGAVQDEVQKQGGCSYWQDWAFPIKPELLEKFACEVHLILCISGCLLFFGGGRGGAPKQCSGWLADTLCNLFLQSHGSVLKPRIAILLSGTGAHLATPGTTGGWRVGLSVLAVKLSPPAFPNLGASSSSSRND